MKPYQTNRITTRRMNDIPESPTFTDPRNPSVHHVDNFSSLNDAKLWMWKKLDDSWNIIHTTRHRLFYERSEFQSFGASSKQRSRCWGCAVIGVPLEFAAGGRGVSEIVVGFALAMAPIRHGLWVALCVLSAVAVCQGRGLPLLEAEIAMVTDLEALASTSAGLFTEILGHSRDVLHFAGFAAKYVFFSPLLFARFLV